MKFLLFFTILLNLTTSFSKELVDKIVASVGSSDVVLYSEVKSFTSKIDKPGFIDDTVLLGESLDSL